MAEKRYAINRGNTKPASKPNKLIAAGQALMFPGAAGAKFATSLGAKYGTKLNTATQNKTKETNDYIKESGSAMDLGYDNETVDMMGTPLTDIEETEHPYSPVQIRGDGKIFTQNSVHGGHYGTDIIGYTTPDGKRLFSNLGSSALQAEFTKRDNAESPSQGYVSSSATGRSLNQDGSDRNAIDPKKLKMLQNAGLVSTQSQEDIAKGKHEAWMHNYEMLVSEGRSSADAKMMADNRREGRELNAGVKRSSGNSESSYISAPSRGGFFENLGRYSALAGANKRARADEQFDRKMSLEEAKGQSAIKLQTKQSDWYDDEARSKVEKRNSQTTGQNIKNQAMPDQLMADLGLTTAKGNKTQAEADAIPSITAASNTLRLAQAGNQNAIAALGRIKAEYLPQQMRAEIGKLMAQTGQIDSATGLNFAKTNKTNQQTLQVAPNAVSQRQLNAQKGNALNLNATSKANLTNQQALQVAPNAIADRQLTASKIQSMALAAADRYKITSAKAASILATTSMQQLLMQSKLLSEKAKRGNLEAKTQLLIVENQINSMFLDKGE